MKKVLVVCILAACCCYLAFAANDPGTVAQMPTKNAAPAVAISADLEHMTIEKALDYVNEMQKRNTLQDNDPIYRWLKDNPKATDGQNGRGNLDQGGDDCASATFIGGLPYCDSGTTIGYVDNYVPGACIFSSGAPDVVYAMSGTGGTIRVSLCGSFFDTGLGVYEGACPDAGGLNVACNDDACGVQSCVSFASTSGTLYYIIVDGFSNQAGDYLINVLVDGGSCPSLPCGAASGRCCYQGGLFCVDGISQADCQNFYGSADWALNETCQSLPCVPPPCTVDAFLAAPGVYNGNTCGAGDDCGIRVSEDLIIEVSIPSAGNWNFSLCDESITFWDSYMLIGTSCCSNDVWNQDDGCGPINYYLSNVNCLTLAAGTYYVTVEGYSPVQCGVVRLEVSQCAPPLGQCCYGGTCTAPGICAEVSEADCQALGGNWVAGGNCANGCPVGGGSLRTIFVPVPTGLGVSIAVDCRGTLIYNNYGEGIIHKVDAFGIPVAAPIPMVDASGAPRYIDEWGWDEQGQQLWGGELGTNAIWTVNPNTGLATYQFPGCPPGFTLTDGCDYDAHNGHIWHSPDVNAFARNFDGAGVFQYDLYALDGVGNPDGSQSGIEVGIGNTIYVGHNGLGYITWNDKISGVRLSILAVVGGRDEGLACDAINFAPQNVLWTKGAYDGSLTALCIPDSSCVCAQLPDTCRFPFQEIDDGDLAMCNYPTLHANPGHGLSNVAWLGGCVTGEPAPNYGNADPCDDGVIYVGMPLPGWTPCTPQIVQVTVTAGPVYGLYEECGGHLYLNGWKDGNIDGDFCDEIPCAGGFAASEWILRDVLVTPGVGLYTVIDPGVLNLGRYDGVFRWRLTHEPVGRYGYGLDLPGACGIGCGTYAFDFLGEVEDYIIEGGQLSAEMTSYRAISGSNSVTLLWTTASETNNDLFEIMKNGTKVGEVAGAGTSADRHDYTWTDGEAINGTTYSYSLVTVDVNGNRQTAGTVEATPSPTSAVVSEYALHQNFPNPFNPETSIMFDMVEAGNVRLSVVNLLGQSVATLVNGNMEAGRHTINFTAADLPSGVYLYTIEVNGFMAQKKMVLMK